MAKNFLFGFFFVILWNSMCFANDVSDGLYPSEIAHPIDDKIITEDIKMFEFESDNILLKNSLRSSRRKRSDCHDPVPCPLGMPGPKGEKGERGYVGLPGMPGLTGIKGDKGYAGEKGQKGIKGSEGALHCLPGLPGPPGPIGPPGHYSDDEMSDKIKEICLEVVKDHIDETVKFLKGEAGIPGHPGRPGDPGRPGSPFGY